MSLLDRTTEGRGRTLAIVTAAIALVAVAGPSSAAAAKAPPTQQEPPPVVGADGPELGPGVGSSDGTAAPSPTPEVDSFTATADTPRSTAWMT